jgi:hypothetical protein
MQGKERCELLGERKRKWKKEVEAEDVKIIFPLDFGGRFNCSETNLR